MPEFTGEGLGRMLLQGVVQGPDPARRAGRSRRSATQRPGTEPGCLAPGRVPRGVGFKTVAPHHRYPRLRLELRRPSWKADVEAALEQLLGSMTIRCDRRSRGRPTGPDAVARHRRAQGAL